MMFRYRIILLVGLILIYFGASAQKRYSKSLNQIYGKRYQPARFFNNKKMKVICPANVINEFPYQGIGVKIGDPFAATYKLYATPWLAVSVDAGFGTYGLYQNQYADFFNNFPQADTVTYFNHRVKNDTYIAFKLSFYNEVPKFLLKNFDYYISLGWQFRYATIQYGFNTNINPTETIFGSFTGQVDYMGPEIGLGIEYSYFDLPIAAFFELNGMYNIMTSPEFFKLQGGVGLRYIF